VIRHIVLLRLKEGAEDAAIDRYTTALGALPQLIPSIVSFTWGRDLGKEHDPSLAGNWDFVVSATFANIGDYVSYATNPAHVALKDEHVERLFGDRAALQIGASLDASWDDGIAQ
jgi:hypothetical protein